MTASLSGLRDDELFLLLDGFFFGDLHDALQPSAEAQTWAKHLVSPPVPAVVGSRMYLINVGHGVERLLTLQDDGSRHSFSLAEGAFDDQLRRVRATLDEAASES